jgi:2-C-methyl-D-erythritol 4-phosphate cytidylyltransferase
MDHPVSGRVGVLVPAAGRGERLGTGAAKALCEIAGTPMLVHAVRSLASAASVDTVVVAAPPEDVEAVRAVLGADILVVAGGDSRPESVRCALRVLPAEVDIVLVHDAARPFVPPSVVEAVVAAVRAGHDAVVPVLPVPDTVKRVAADGRVIETLSRADLYAAQTPQGFRRDVLAAAHAKSWTDATDDALLVERLGIPVWTVPGAADAFKVTWPEDLLRAEAVLAATPVADRDA